uniref:Uncharacterized protein n=1 Tax=Populus trichocarpa TaxID=3694 RepID=A0A3N7F5N0_POPTR
MINTSTASGDTLIDIHSSGRHVTFPDENNQSNQLRASVPLLLQPSYARSKSLLFDELRNFRISLKWCALDHSTCIGKFVSCFIFVFLAIILPIVSSLSIRVPSSAPANDPISYNKLVQLPESVLALISFFSLFRFFKRYGLRQLLFLDDLQEDSLFIRRGYSRELDKAFRYLACILLPSFFVEVAHKIIFFSTVKIWLPCVIFREHVRIKKQLSFTSHRYRFFIISCLVTITVSQFGSLLLVLGFNNEKNFFNSGDLVICSAVQLCGFFLCLLGAARITHRAQGIVSMATRWHMIVASASASARIDQGKSHVPEADGTLASNTEDSESDSSDNFIAISSQDPCSFQTRQALVAYLQHNNGGITLFGFALDRGLLHTLFAFEFSLVLWILSKVVVLS